MRKLILPALVLVALLVVFAPEARASQPAVVTGHVYTNNDDKNGNSVTSFLVTQNGLVLKGTTSTNGVGCGGGYYAANRIKVVNAGDLILASNDCSNDLAVLKGGDNPTLLGNVPTPGGETSLVVAGNCAAAAFYNTNEIVSYQLSKSPPYLTPVSTISVQGPIAGMSATRAGGKFYLAGAMPDYLLYASVQGNPADCSLGNLAYINSGVGQWGNPASVAFLTFGTKTVLYGGAANRTGAVIDYCPGFPDATCTGYLFEEGLVMNSNTILVGAYPPDKPTSFCAFLGIQDHTAVASIKLSPIDGRPQTATHNIFGNDWYVGTMAWHNTKLGFFAASSAGLTNDVWMLQVNWPDCAIWKPIGPFATPIIDGSHMTSITADPQVGP